MTDPLTPEDRALYDAFFVAYKEKFAELHAAAGDGAQVTLDVCTVHAIKAMTAIEIAKLRDAIAPSLKMLVGQAAECFPEINERGQKHFVRVVMESAAEELKEILGDPGDATAGAIQPQGEESDRKTNEFGEGQRAGRVPQGVSQVDRRRDGDAGNAEGSSVCFVRHAAEASKSAYVAGRDEAGRGRHVGGEGHHCLNEKAAGGSTREDGRSVEQPGATSGHTGTNPATGFFDFQGHLAHQAMWSEATFGPGERLNGVSEHIRKELDEVGEAHRGVERQAEWIDVVILALDGAWRSGMSPRQIIDGIVAKQRKNEGRTWPDWRTADPSKAIEHDRAKDAPAAGFFVERTPELDAMFDAPAADICVWTDEIPQPEGHLRMFANSTCGRPEFASNHFALEELGKPLRCQCGHLISIEGEVEAGRILPREKVAGAATHEVAGAGLSPASGQAPATDQSPDFCEWKALSHEHFMRQCSKYPTLSAAGPYCSNCGKTIVEAK